MVTRYVRRHTAFNRKAIFSANLRYKKSDCRQVGLGISEPTHRRSGSAYPRALVITSVIRLAKADGSGSGSPSMIRA